MVECRSPGSGSKMAILSQHCPEYVHGADHALQMSLSLIIRWCCSNVIHVI